MTALLLAFSWSWNDYINPLVFLSNDKLFTLTVGLQRFSGRCIYKLCIDHGGSYRFIDPTDHFVPVYTEIFY